MNPSVNPMKLRFLTNLVTLLLMAACGQQSTTVVAPAAAKPASPAQSAPAPAPVAPASSHDKFDAAAPVAPLDEEAILADPTGQWANSAEASSTFGDSQGTAGYAAWQATGAPNVPRYADHSNAWATRNGDTKQPEWLRLTFEKPVYATALRIRQTAAPGAISKLELIDQAGGVHVIWESNDTTAYPKNTIGWLQQQFEPTPYLVTGARITLVTDRVWGWNEIDAVQLAGTAEHAATGQ